MGYSGELHRIGRWKEASGVVRQPGSGDERDGGSKGSRDAVGIEQQEMTVGPGWGGELDDDELAWRWPREFSLPAWERAREKKRREVEDEMMAIELPISIY